MQSSSSSSTSFSAISAPSTSSADVVELTMEDRRALMRNLGLVEQTIAQAAPTWEYHFQYDEEEDLLNINVEEKHKELDLPKDSRLFIQTIFVEDFKSYGGRHEIGPFHKNLTMVIGPNGSGKSNVLDALLFAFGYNGSRMRTTKSEALIHSSAGRSPDQCKVEVHMAVIKDIDEERYDVVPDASFSVTRVFTRGHSSSYRINEKTSTKTEVRELLRSAGIDFAHSRFMILQGEVERISRMKPDTRISYVEEVVGTERFKEPMAKLEHRYDCHEYAGQKMKADVKRFKTIAGRLEESMRKSVKKVENENQLNFLRREQLKRAIAQKTNTVEAARDRLCSDEAILKNKRTALRDAAKAIVKQEATVKAVEKEHADLEGSKKEKEALKFNNGNELFRLKTNYKAAIMKQAEMEEETRNAKRHRDEASLVPETLKDRIAVLSDRLEAEQRKRDEAKQMTSIGLDAFDQMDVEREARELNSERYGAANMERNELEKKRDILQASIRVEEEERQKVSTLNEMTTTLNEMTTALDKSRAAHYKASRRIEKAERDKETLAAKIAKMENDALQKMKVLSGKKARLEDLDAASSRDVTDTLHRLAAEGKLDGYCGRLGDLGSIAESYNVTISTAFASSLDCHITRDKDVSARAIDLLYEERKRGTFMSLDKMKAFTSDKHTDTNLADPTNKYNGRRLIDKIRTRSLEHKKWFYFFLGDTLVKNKYEDAKALSEKYHTKCVYGEGSMVDEKGNVTGGGPTISGKIGINRARVNRSREIQSLKDVIDVKERAYAEIVKSLEQKRDKMKRAEQKVEKRQLEKSQLPRLRESLPGEIEKLKSEIAVMRASLVSTESTEAANLEEMQTDMEKLVVSIRRHLPTCEALKNKFGEFEKKKTELYDDLVTKHQNVFKEAAQECATIEEQIATQQAQKAAAPSKIERAQRKVNECVGDEKEHQKKLQGLESDFKRCDDEDSKLHNELIQIDSQLKELSETRLKSAKEELARAQKCKDDLVEELEKAHAQCKECREEVGKMEDDLEKDEEEYKKRAECWKRVEDLDPTTHLVRHDSEDRENQVAHGALVIPSNVFDGVTDYERMDRTGGGEQSVDDVNEAILEVMVENLEMDFDEKAVSNYVKVKTLELNEKRRLEENDKKAFLYKRKLEELRATRREELSDALAFLGSVTGSLYNQISNSGGAQINFVDPGENPFDAGIDFSVRPPHKGWKGIDALSGGEKTLASLCFVFAMHHYRPSPFYIMDEIDAALDPRNVWLIATYLKTAKMIQRSQFIVISLRNQMFSMANRLIGVYKVAGLTYNIVVSQTQVRRGIEAMQAELNRKIAEEEKKRIEEAYASNDEPPPSVIAKPKRKLGKFKMSDFFGDEIEEEMAFRKALPRDHPTSSDEERAEKRQRREGDSQ